MRQSLWLNLDLHDSARLADGHWSLRICPSVPPCTRIRVAQQHTGFSGARDPSSGLHACTASFLPSEPVSYWILIVNFSFESFFRPFSLFLIIKWETERILELYVWPQSLALAQHAWRESTTETIQVFWIQPPFILRNSGVFWLSVLAVCHKVGGASTKDHWGGIVLCPAIRNRKLGTLLSACVCVCTHIQSERACSSTAHRSRLKDNFRESILSLHHGFQRPNSSNEACRANVLPAPSCPQPTFLKTEFSSCTLYSNGILDRAWECPSVSTVTDLVT